MKFLCHDADDVIQPLLVVLGGRFQHCQAVVDIA
jgi:hypothetical protein